MSKQRATFAKLQRERDKKAKAEAKREQRLNGPDPSEEQDDQPVVEAADQGAILDALAKLHEDYADGRMELDEFEERKQELTSRLAVS